MEPDAKSTTKDDPTNLLPNNNKVEIEKPISNETQSIELIKNNKNENKGHHRKSLSDVGLEA